MHTTLPAPDLTDVKSPTQAAKVLGKAGIEPFSDAAEAIVIDLIEAWADKHSTEAAKDLVYLIRQAKWLTGYKTMARAMVSQLPE